MEISNVLSNPVYAGFWRRLVGQNIDFLILIIICHWANVLISFVYTPSFPSSLSFSSIFSAVWSSVLIVVVVDFFIFALYYCLLEASPLQATIGKYIAGLKIIDINGSKISYKKAFLRRISSLLSIIPIFIGYFAAGFTPKKQTFHDMLAKTFVVVEKKRSVLILIVIFILTLALGILSDRYLGAGFHIWLNSPSYGYDTRNGAQNYIVQKGDQVDPVLKNAIISALVSQKSIYASGDVAAIRQHLVIGDPANSKKITSASDTDLKNLANLYNQVANMATEDMLRSPDAIWTFNQDKTAVKVAIEATLPDGTQESVSIYELYNNGQWYF